MIVPVSVNNGYELTRKNLENMWKTCVEGDCLKNISLQVKQNTVLIKGKGGGSVLNSNFQYLCM